MSEEAHSPPTTPQRKKTVRMTTGGRPPRKRSVERYLDVEAEENNATDIEGDLDSYDADFIDDSERIKWSRSPSPMPSKPKSNAAIRMNVPAPVLDGPNFPASKRKDVVLPSTPMTTRSRSKSSGVSSSTTMGSHDSPTLNTKGYQGSRSNVHDGIKTSAIQLRSVPDDSQGQHKLEVFKRTPGQVTISAADHEEFLRFKRSQTNAQSVDPHANLGGKQQVTFASLPAPTLNDPYERAQKEISATAPVTASDSPGKGARKVQPGTERGGSDSAPAQEHSERNPKSRRISHSNAGVKGKTAGSSDRGDRPDQEVLTSDSESLSSPEPSRTDIVNAKKPKGSAAVQSDDDVSMDERHRGVHNTDRSVERNKHAGKTSRKPLKRNRVESDSDRSSSEPPEKARSTGAVKKAKIDSVVLKEIEARAVRELPLVCEVMDIALQDEMMKPIYALPHPFLKKANVKTWSSNTGRGMYKLSNFPTSNPGLIFGTVWSLLLLVRKGPYVNLARIDPRLLEARADRYSKDVRWVLNVDKKPAICISVVNVMKSSLLSISTVFQATKKSTPMMKYITGVHLSQEFDRVVAMCGMVFELPLMHVQLSASALTFSTRSISIQRYEELTNSQSDGIQSSSSMYSKPLYSPASDTLSYEDKIPVYDARYTGFDASTDIDNLDRILPRYTEEIPENTCAAVAYTVSHYKNAQAEDHASFNIKWVVVLGEAA